MKRIGIMGGTFDPIHRGHILIAKAAQKKFKLDKILFIPTGTPPHKTRKISPKKHRLHMTQLAIAGNAEFQLSRCEIDRKGYSYAVDTLKYLRKRYAKNTKFYYIIGTDTLNEVLTWKRPFELFKLCEFLVATRPGASMRTARRMIKLVPLKKYTDKMHWFERDIDISSTNIRQRTKKGRSVKRLLPPKVEKYIIKQGLYK